MGLLQDILDSQFKDAHEKAKRKQNGIDEPSLLGALKDPQFRQDVRRGLLDSLNRGAVASTIGGPVDLATLALRPLGYNVEKPIGGSEWVGDKMQQMGLLGDTRNPIAEAIASVAVPGAMTKAGQGLFKAEQAAIKNAQMPSPMNGALRNQAGAIVWHGSPHKFDKFDSSKIGTGEGAQAYGHGLYLAESKDVGKDYMNALSDSVIKFSRPPKTDAEKEVADFIFNRAKVMQTGHRQSEADAAWGMLANPTIDKIKGNSYMGIPPMDAAGIARMEAAKDLGRPTIDSAGNLYKVDLPDEQIAKMLDWDKPLSQQHPDVQAAIEPFVKAEGDPYNLVRFYNPKNPLGSPTGQDVYEALATAGYRQNGTGANHAQFAAEQLKPLGIPGIRYLDGGSRGTGAGTSNFVVFPGNEDMLKILERNGQPMGLLGP